VPDQTPETVWAAVQEDVPSHHRHAFCRRCGAPVAQPLEPRKRLWASEGRASQPAGARHAAGGRLPAM